MANLPKHPAVKTRTAPSGHELEQGRPCVFVIPEGHQGKIPNHYFPGHGLIESPQPGDEIKLAAGIKAGRFIKEVDAGEKAKADAKPQVDAAKK